MCRTDVQRDADARDAGVVQRAEQRLVEVEAGGRRRDRAAPLGEHGLIAVAIVSRVGPVDVRRSGM
jgi:hypothetical protein